MALPRAASPPAACVALAGLVFGLLVAASFQAHASRELQRLENGLHLAQAAAHAAEAELTLLRRQAAPLPQAVASLPHVATTDFFLRNLGGSPNEDPPQTQRFLLCLTVGVKQKATVHALVQKFDLRLFTIVLCHYDGHQTFLLYNAPEAADSTQISVKSQTKWWYARRFLHPAVVARYELIFVWDEDIGVSEFDANRYVQLVLENSLDISQPAVGGGPVSWPITRRVPGSVLHRGREDMGTTPCVEVMVPVFSAKAWRCVWAMLPNDLVHAFGLDLAWHVCAGAGNSTSNSMAVVDAVPIEHLGAPTLGEQGQVNTQEGLPAWMSVNNRRNEEWKIFSARWDAAQRRAKKQSNGT